MKKLLTLVMTAALILTLSSIFASAADTIDPDGYKFDIKTINGKVENEIGIIITSQDAIASANLNWPVIIICEKVSNNVYKVKQDPILPKGTAPSLTLNKDEIIIAIHSSSSDITQKEQYKNVEQKVAASNVKPGMYFTFEGIDLEKGTVNNGKAICSAKAPENVPGESSKPAESSEASSAVSSAAASSAAPQEESNGTSSIAASAASSSGVTSEIEAESGLSTTTIIIIIAAVVVVVAVVGIILAKKKK